MLFSDNGRSIARGEIVNIAIGPDKNLYHIHKELICHHSEYFRTAYNDRWKESDEGVALGDVEVEVFNIFVHWIYSQDLPRDICSALRIAERKVPPPADLSPREAWWGLMLRSAAFGDRFLAQNFQHLVHNIYVDSHWKENNGRVYYFTGYKEIIWAFESLAADNPILNLMVDLQCLAWKEEYDDEEEKLLWSQLPHSFLLRIMQKQGTLSGQDRTKVVIKPCSYHLHATPEEKEACVWQHIQG